MTTSNKPSFPSLFWLALALVVGVILGLPTGWLLATLAVLPMFLGLFFFLIVGLFIGAIMFRVGKQAAPVPKSTLITIGSIVAMTVWGAALVFEFRQLPEDAARTVRSSFPKRYFDKQDRVRLQNETRDYVLAKLKEDYPPGGLVGYLRWAADKGTIECPRIFSDDTETHALYQQGLMWIIRVLLSLLLVGFTTITQFVGLTSIPAKPAQTPNGIEVGQDGSQP
ncbi:MAG: hypothetical protein ACYTF1_12905 [Planctomycetota bacterium]|jgi:hypothetical protein